MPNTNQSALGIPEEHWENAKRRSKAEDIPVLAMRFEGDFLCKAGRFDALREGLGDKLREVVLPGKKHSVLTIHFETLTDEEKTRVWGELTSYLASRLKP